MKTSRTIKAIIAGLTFAAIAVTTVGCGQKEETQTIRVADSADGVKFGIAEKLGFWEDEFSEDGIVVEGITIVDGPSFVDSVTAGEVDFGVFGDQPIISAYASGKDVEIIGRTEEDTKCFRLAANVNSGIEVPADLKGKRVAYAAGTANEKILKQILEAEGLTEDDIEGVNLPLTDAITALAAGEIDATVYSIHNGANIDKSAIVDIADYADYGKSIHIIAASTKFAEENPELTARVLKVYDRTAEWLNENEEEAIEIIQELGDYTEEQAQEVYDEVDREVGFNESDVDVLSSTAQFLYESGIIDHEVSTDDFVDTQYLESAGLLR